MRTDHRVTQLVGARGQNAAGPGGSRAQRVMPPAAARSAASTAPDPPVTVALYRFAALRVFGATALIVLAERALEAWLRPGPMGTIVLVVAASGLLIGAFHVLVGRRLWALVCANRRLAEGDLAAAALPVARVRDEIDLILAWRNQMLQRLIATAQENAQLYAETDEKLRRRVRELQVLYTVNRSLVAESDLDMTLQLILERMVEAAGAYRGAILLLDSDAGRLQVRATHHHLPLDDVSMLADDLSRTLLRRDEATGTMKMLCDPLVIGEAGTTRARVCFPLQSAGGPIGGVYLERSGKGHFDGEVVSLLSVLADDCALAIERVQLAGKAAQAEAYRRADALKGEFLANVSHDLRNPLTFIQAMAELLATRPFPDHDRPRMLREIVVQAQNMTAMINDLLDLSQLEAGRLELRPEPIDLGELLETVSGLFAGGSAKHHLAVEIARHPLVVISDRRRLQQILGNLVANAIRYSPAGGTVTLRAAVENTDVTIEVEDQGIGIPPEELPLIFDRFHRVRSAATAEIPGTGLGLAIVERLVRALGGTVDVRSQVGRGSVFRVTLPGRSPGDGSTS